MKYDYLHLPGSEKVRNFPQLTQLMEVEPEPVSKARALSSGIYYLCLFRIEIIAMHNSDAW